MKFEQYIHYRRFVKHLAGAARQRALGRCSSDDGGARAPTGLGGDGAKARAREDRPGKPERSPGGTGGGGGAAGRGVEVGEEVRARALECAARCSGRPKYTARLSVFDRAPNPL